MKRKKCLQKELDRADIVRDVRFSSRCAPVADNTNWNTRSRTLADNLGEIELPASGIGSGDEQTAYRVDRSTEESAMTKGVTRYLGPC